MEACTTVFSGREIVQYPGCLLHSEGACTRNIVSRFSLISSHHGTDFLAYSPIPFFKHAFYHGLYKRGLIFICTHSLPLTPVSALWRRAPLKAFTHCPPSTRVRRTSVAASVGRKCPCPGSLALSHAKPLCRICFPALVLDIFCLKLCFFSCNLWQAAFSSSPLRFYRRCLGMRGREL